jgi:beta-phosphoglucomutase-like phosphatase (HAD superfamily)
VTAVVFDVDGVLVDSESHSQASCVEVLGRHGLSITLADVEACTGFGYEDTHSALVGEAIDRVPGPEALWPELLEALGRSFHAGLDRFDDAVTALERLAFDGIPVGLATASRRSRLDLTLEVSGVGRYAQATAAGDEVDVPKPAPDVYLLAAERLGVDPRACIAIEDSPTGARAAAAAGMRTFGVARRDEDMSGLLAAGAAVGSSVDYELLTTWL